jgi:hypothetical protein
MKNITFLFVVLFSITMGLNACASNPLKVVSGNGNVTKELREVASFTGIKASAGIDVYLFQGDEEKVIVEADDNLLEYIVTRVEGSTLHCYIDCNIRNSKKTTVYVNYKQLNKINASSGSDVYGETVLKTDFLDIDVSSGADLKIEVEVDDLNCSVSSGSDAVLRGQANTFVGNASSGAGIKAESLTAKECRASSSSAGDIKIRVTEKIEANASSGGDISYWGNPTVVNVRRSSGGDVNKRN